MRYSCTLQSQRRHGILRERACNTAKACGLHGVEFSFSDDHPLPVGEFDREYLTQPSQSTPVAISRSEKSGGFGRDLRLDPMFAL